MLKAIFIKDSHGGRGSIQNDIFHLSDTSTGNCTAGSTPHTMLNVTVHKDKEKFNPFTALFAFLKHSCFLDCFL